MCYPNNRPTTQEALLPQTDRATQYDSQNLVNCRTTVGTSRTRKPRQIEVAELYKTLRSTVVDAVSKLDLRRVLLTTL